MRPRLMCAALAAVLCTALCAGQVEPPAGAEMPLELYQKIKNHFDLLYGAQSALLPGIAPPSKAETEKALRADAAANKDALVKALGSPAVIHRELAARALEYCGDKKAAVEALSKALAVDAESSVRRACAAALAKLPDASAVDALVKGLGDSSDSVRGICATALGNIKDARAAEPLLKLLGNEPKPIVRMQAATALGKIKDKATLEKLAKALEAEKDERVRMALAGAIRAIAGESGEAAQAMPTVEDAQNELSSLAKEMREVEEKLRADRHDQAVQVQGSGIEKRLAQLIEKLNQCSQSQGQQGQNDKKQQQQQQQGNQKNQGKSASNPLQESKLGGPTPPGQVNPALVAGKQDAWAKLPPAQRDELLQAFREDIPERWRKRLEAYFLSVAAEEAKEAEK